MYGFTCNAAAGTLQRTSVRTTSATVRTAVCAPGLRCPRRCLAWRAYPAAPCTCASSGPRRPWACSVGQRSRRRQCQSGRGGRCDLEARAGGPGLRDWLAFCASYSTRALGTWSDAALSCALAPCRGFGPAARRGTCSPCSAPCPPLPPPQSPRPPPCPPSNAVPICLLPALAARRPGPPPPWLCRRRNSWAQFGTFLGAAGLGTAASGGKVRLSCRGRTRGG
mmetsp:Transcript_20267/g.45304  ORF Transcript_20267/g.45304 Transcript_20267/m.45304 type:complete len:223 (+) Transcript_20267:58-726(+)